MYGGGLGTPTMAGPVNHQRKRESWLTKESMSRMSTIALDVPSTNAPAATEDVRLDLPDDAKTSRPDEQSTNFSGLRQFLGSVSTKKQRTADEEDIRGPLGLHLLHSSEQSLIDIVFVHGLGGGSIKTWRKGKDPRLFWPKLWLPLETDLSNASIHSFGYNSDWKSLTPSILNIHDFGRALYEEMRSSPNLRKKSKSPIILIGHSMGGLVIKKAYILAHQDAVHRDLAERIRCTVFLATPHHGSDYASLLNGVLKVSGFMSSREYISDINNNSISARLINDDFAKHSGNLQIYSFYETLPMVIGSSLVVAKESAVLGVHFKNEVSRYMNANHRTICKFDSPDDSNYVSLRNSLTCVVQDLLQHTLFFYAENSKLQLQKLQAFLSISTTPVEYHEKLEGSCTWLDEREDFQQWRDIKDDLNTTDPTRNEPSIYWVTAKPGTGKSVLVSHVLANLKEKKLQHAFYHFHAGINASQSLSYFLRSMSYQMAASNTAVCDELGKLYDGGCTFDPDDARAIWAKIFRAGIFQAPMSIPQYWVIDAIDECFKYVEFLALLKGMQPSFPLRIFITSRQVPELQKVTQQLQGCTLSIIEIPVHNTMNDIKLFVQAQIGLLSIDTTEEKENLLSEILAKSDACFLWVQLVMEELAPLHIFETMMSVLQGIPEGMVSYYQKTITEMAENRREKHIMKAILMWVVCSTRSLTIFELSEALNLDINVRLPNTKFAVEGLCGQLVSVDKQTSLVHIIHLTAREFLLSDEAGEFKISKSEAHERIALTVLQLLVSPPMQPPRHRRLIGQRGHVKAISPLLDYSITQFSEHIFSASTERDKILVALNKFLTTTILSWIEKIVTRNFLHHLIRVSKDLKGYLDRRARFQSPLHQYISTIDGWAADLSRLATKFGGALTSQPRSVYFLIPPLCPTNTAIYRQFGKSSEGLMVSGFQNSYWDDCAASVSFEAETAAAVACENNLIAVGFWSGEIHLYNHTSFQKERIIRHLAPIDLLLLDPLGSFIISSCIKYITAWNLGGTLLWQKRLRSRCIALTASSTFIAGLTMSGRVIHWEVATGKQIEDHPYPYQPLDPNSRLQEDLVKAPSKASFGPGFELLAIAYRNAPTCIYELHGHSWLAWAMDEYPRQMVVELVFNPNPEVNLLLIAYDDSRLSLYDSWSGTLLQSRDPEIRAIPTSLSCSTDGRTFGTVDVLGNLQIWDFESLTLLFHLMTPNQSFRILGFTSDGFNLVDIMDHKMKIWSPSALVRKIMEEEASLSEQAIILPVKKGQLVTFNSSRIRCTIAHQTRPVVFVGNYHGDVMAYKTVNAENCDPISPLYSHDGALVKCLAVQGDVIASADDNGRVQVWQLDNSGRNMIKAGKLKGRIRVSAAICQILFDQTGKYLLVSTMDSDHVYDVEDGTLVGSLPFEQNKRSIWKWAALPDPKYTQHFTLIHNHELVYYHAPTFQIKCSGARVELQYNIADGFVETGIDFAALHPQSMSLILDVRQQLGFVTKNVLFVFKLPKLSTETSTVALQPSRTLVSDFTHFLGISQTDQRLIYLNRTSWVSSINLSSMSKTDDARHFFVPNEYMTNSDNILPVQTADDKFVFCLYDKLAIVKNGLLFKELKAAS